MDAWSYGRVALVGDARFCPSLLAGQGSAVAMLGAYILAGELKRAAGDQQVAFSKYERTLRRFIEKKQRAAESFSRSFAPRTTRNLRPQSRDGPYVTAVRREIRAGASPYRLTAVASLRLHLRSQQCRRARP